MSATGGQVQCGLRLGLALLLAAALCQQLCLALDHEQVLCANDNVPHCARSSGDYLIFKNECDLRKAQRQNLMGGPLPDVALYNCLPSCEFECDRLFQPICGVSVISGQRKTFRNRCEMARTACLAKSDWLVYKWGVCPIGRSQPKQTAHTVLVGQRKPRRPIPCTNVYRPVCASYAGVKSTFSNECLVNAENVRTRRNWRVISEGLCGEDSTKMKHSRKYKPKSKPKANGQRSKRSHRQPDQLDLPDQGSQANQVNQLDDFELPQDAVQIFAPSTFHTQFISNSGTMEKSYSLPARKPYLATRPKSQRRRNDALKLQQEKQQQQQVVPPAGCVFSNEPVCGSFNGDTRTFANVCALMQYSQAVGNAWTILYEGSCRRCDKPCPTVYSPICASRNGIGYTIINECYLERVRCKDPNSNWRITHKGECAPLNDDVAQSISKSKSSAKPTSRIPQMLYAANQSSSSSFSTTPSTRNIGVPKGPAAAPRRRLRKLRRPTTTTTPTSTTTTTTTPMPTRKDLSNRKIRKTAMISASDFDASMSPFDPLHPFELPATAKDNWLVRQTIDNVKNKFNKRPSPKKAYAAKYPHFNWPVMHTTPAPLLATTESTATATTTTATPTIPVNAMDGFTVAELLNLEAKPAGQLYGEMQGEAEGEVQAEAETEILFMMDSTTLAPVAGATTTQATTPRPTKASTTTTKTITTTIAHPTLPSTTLPTTSTTVRTTTTTAAAAAAALTAASASGVSEETTELLDPSTTDTAETSSAGEAVDEQTTTPNLDYMADEPLSSQSEQTSIYGLDKNSLIMRLLRARSSKNMVL
ncbi:hypothetical protein KR222_007000 [Zaprionus bogoriensis]|nr:hypothetical protein KR222_007000 [Zaprionus bogoriensis]